MPQTRSKRIATPVKDGQVDGDAIEIKKSKLEGVGDSSVDEVTGSTEMVKEVETTNGKSEVTGDKVEAVESTEKNGTSNGTSEAAAAAAAVEVPAAANGGSETNGNAEEKKVEAKEVPVESSETDKVDGEKPVSDEVSSVVADTESSSSSKPEAAAAASSSSAAVSAEATPATAATGEDEKVVEESSSSSSSTKTEAAPAVETPVAESTEVASDEAGVIPGSTDQKKPEETVEQPSEATVAAN